MSSSARAAVFVACAVLTAALTVVPEPERSPLGRVAAFDGDGPDPRYDTPVDGAALRRAADLVPGGTYAIVAPSASPLLQGNLKAAAQIFLSPALPVQDRREADWLLVYGAAPPGEGRVHRVGRDVFLVDRTR